MNRSKLARAIDAERWASTQAVDAVVSAGRTPPRWVGESLLDAAEAWREAGDPQRGDDLEKEAAFFARRLSETKLAELVARRLESWGLRLTEFVGSRSRPIETKGPLRRIARLGAVLPIRNTLQEAREAFEEAGWQWRLAGDETRAEDAFRLAGAVGRKAPRTVRRGRP